MTEKCNLSCPFCYAFKDSEDPSFEELLEVGYSLASQGVVKVNLMGGEPLLQRHVFNIIDTFWSSFDISITTNGTLLAGDDIRRLCGKLERITISLDTLNRNIGKKMRGDNYKVSCVINAVSNVINYGIPLKINTVITKLNLKNLDGIGNLLTEFNAPVFWKLFELTYNTNVLRNLKAIKPSKSEIAKCFCDLCQKFPELLIDIATSEELNSNYIIVRMNGDIYVPSLGNYQVIGNVCKDDVASILTRNGFAFNANRKIYIDRMPQIKYEGVQNAR